MDSIKRIAGVALFVLVFFISQVYAADRKNEGIEAMKTITVYCYNEGYKLKNCSELRTRYIDETLDVGPAEWTNNNAKWCELACEKGSEDRVNRTDQLPGLLKIIDKTTRQR